MTTPIDVIAGGDIAITSEVERTPEARQRHHRKRPLGLIMTFGWLGFVVLAALLADVLPLKDPGVDAGAGVRTAPFTMWAEPLGTDGQGRSVLARAVFGARISLVVGLAAVALAFVVGLTIGVVAGYLRRWVDTTIGLFLDAVIAFPALVLLLALVAVLEPGISTLILGLGIVATPSFARIARATTLTVAASEYVTAARGLGAKSRTVLFREIVPNVAISLLGLSGVVAAFLILAEAGLSFLGLGIPPPDPSWGNMVATSRPDMRDHPSLLFIPMILLFLTIYALNVIGDWLASRSEGTAKL